MKINGYLRRATEELTMSFSYTITINDVSSLPEDNALYSVVQAAANDWSSYLSGLGSIDIVVNVVPGITRANGGPGTMVGAGTDGLRTVYEPGTVSELLSGVDPNGVSPDVVINVDSSYLENTLWLDPNPNDPIIGNRVDGVSVMRHELGHGLGITGWRGSTGSLPSGYESTWDRLVEVSADGSAWFVGAHAEAVYGGPVLVTSVQNMEQYFHLGNSTSDQDGQDLMNGVAVYYGTRYQISSLDVAILQDLGLAASSVSADDYANNTSTTGRVTVGGSSMGTLETAGDHDWFRVNLISGHTYTIDLNGSGHNGGTLSDPYLRLYNSSEQLLGQNDDSRGTLDSELTYVASVSDAYYVDAGAYNDSLAGTYTVNVVDNGGSSYFSMPSLQLSAFGLNAGGWSSDTSYPRVVGDVNGDGKADIVGFGNAGVYVALATGYGTFGTPSLQLSAFALNAGGWSSNNNYPRLLADVNGDGMADIVGFGSAGVYVALATGNGSFGAPSLRLSAFGVNAGGWSSDDAFPRAVADVNGDGKADIVGFGNAGVYVALATGDGTFGTPSLQLSAFALNAGGWSSANTYPRVLADVNGDGMADIVGFGSAGVYVALATGNGSFGAPSLRLSAFGVNAGGWSSDIAYPREVADVNGDGKADIVGFGNAGVYVALATGDGSFAQPVFGLSAFGSNAGGWSSDTTFPRMLADVNGDHHADIVGFNSAGVYVSTSS